MAIREIVYNCLYDGTLVANDCVSKLTNVLIQFTPESCRDLINVLNCRTITADNQMLQVKQIKFDQDGIDIFIQGQSSLVRSGNGITMPVFKGTTLGYRGEFNALVIESDGSRHNYIINIGSIEFRGTDGPYTEDNIAEFDDGVAILYPTGIYKAEHK